jgi:hypothetical protein
MEALLHQLAAVAQVVVINDALAPALVFRLSSQRLYDVRS